MQKRSASESAADCRLHDLEEGKNKNELGGKSKLGALIKRYVPPNIYGPPNIEHSKRMARDDVAHTGACMDTEEKYARSIIE